MKTEFKDVWHLYLGCPVFDVNYPEEGLMTFTVETITAYSNDKKGRHWTELIKLALRPVSNMTEEEKEYYDLFLRTISKQQKLSQSTTHATSTCWLLFRGFDLFGLIESGQAISRQTIDK